MTTTKPIATAALATPRAPAAIAAIHLAGQIQTILANLKCAPVPVGAVALRNIANIDTAVIAIIDERSALLTPHAGPAVVDALMTALQNAGAQIENDNALKLYPEAQDEIEALALLALSRAASPRAVALLLDQPRRWRESTTTSPDEINRVSARLNHLITPPTIVAAGPPNIGKSTLLNTLAGRTVSVVADAPGVTRDHVGALLELDALTLRWIDAPGIRPPENDIEARAIELAKELITRADLVLTCSDPTTPPIEFTTNAAHIIPICLRADLAKSPPPALAVSATTKAGLTDLAKAVRSALVPDSALESPAPWRFDPRLPAIPAPR